MDGLRPAALLPDIRQGHLHPTAPLALARLREQLDLSQHGGLARPHASRVTLKQINSWYEGGRPSNRIQSAGVLIHTRDNTEQQGGPWKLPFPGERQFQNFWATSIVNKDLPGLYSYTCGLVLDPAFANVLCSYHTDFTSWNGGCNRTGLSSLSWDMPNKQDTPYPPDQLEDMMNASLRLQRPASGNFQYNEVIVDSQAYRQALPGSVAAVFYVQGGEGDHAGDGDPECAQGAHAALVQLYGLNPDDVMLLRHQPRGSPAFVPHVQAGGATDARAEYAHEHVMHQHAGPSSDARELEAPRQLVCISIDAFPGIDDAWCAGKCLDGNCPSGSCKCGVSGQFGAGRGVVARTRPKLQGTQLMRRRRWKDLWWAALEPE